MLLNYLASSLVSNATCTVNGQPASCKEAGGILAGLGILVILFIILSIVSFVFWVVSLIHLIKHADVENRVMWIVIVLLVPFGSWVYFFGPRRSYNKSHNGNVGAGGYVAPNAQTGSAPIVQGGVTPQQPPVSGSVVGSNPNDNQNPPVNPPTPAT